MRIFGSGKKNIAKDAVSILLVITGVLLFPVMIVPAVVAASVGFFSWAKGHGWGGIRKMTVMVLVGTYVSMIGMSLAGLYIAAALVVTRCVEVMREWFDG